MIVVHGAGGGVHRVLGPATHHGHAELRSVRRSQMSATEENEHRRIVAAGGARASSGGLHAARDHDRARDHRAASWAASARRCSTQFKKAQVTDGARLRVKEVARRDHAVHDRQQQQLPASGSTIWWRRSTSTRQRQGSLGQGLHLPAARAPTTPTAPTSSRRAPTSRRAPPTTSSPGSSSSERDARMQRGRSDDRTRGSARGRARVHAHRDPGRAGDRRAHHRPRRCAGFARWPRATCARRPRTCRARSATCSTARRPPASTTGW